MSVSKHGYAASLESPTAIGIMILRPPLSSYFTGPRAIARGFKLKAQLDCCAKPAYVGILLANARHAVAAVRLYVSLFIALLSC